MDILYNHISSGKDNKRYGWSIWYQNRAVMEVNWRWWKDCTPRVSLLWTAAMEWNPCCLPFNP